MSDHEAVLRTTLRCSDVELTEFVLKQFVEEEIARLRREK